jgi:sulfatase modifying factor 1
MTIRLPIPNFSAPAWILLASCVHAGVAPASGAAGGSSFTNSLGMTLVPVPAGEFIMGSRHGDRDEEPLHRVTLTRGFHLGATEVTNAQYELFDPAHRQLRGKLGLSNADDEAVIFVNWHDAAAFCTWLAKKEGRPYRLPTEAEWEYACRAGTTTEFHTGDTLPAVWHNNQKKSWFPDPERKDRAVDIGPLLVGRTPPNAWGLHDLHGNVEEWCHDWYGPYDAGAYTDPVGRAAGIFRVSRGGSHSTELRFLRSANRLGGVPEDRSWLIGFRVALGELPVSPPRPAIVGAQLHEQAVRQDVPAGVTRGPDPAKAFFRGPRRFVRATPTSERGPYFEHHHVPALTELPNGDLFAIWYTGKGEQGRELHFIASRLRHGAAEWDPASESFFSPPDRNPHTAALWWDGDRTVFHFQGISAAATWGSLALLVRTSTDNAVTWSAPRFLNPEHGLRNMPIASVVRLGSGAIVFSADAVTGGQGGSAVWVSEDGGSTFRDPGAGRLPPEFREGGSGAWIAGIHAPIAPLSDGVGLIGFGRGNNIAGRMPVSVSRDLGATWTYRASPFDPLGSGQRATALRLREGPLFLASFTKNMQLRDAAGQPRSVNGLFAAISFDDGATWPHQRLITDDGPPRQFHGGAWTGAFELGPTAAEPKGYLTSVQARNGVVHLISSALHYEFNLAWLRAPMPAEP